jgi:phosphopantetheinyl transferase (holo-ACP synthase)
MTGNDIVDIKTAAAESNWKRKGFIEKIFTPQEQQYIIDAIAPDEIVWKLWSMKESAYKIYTRQYGGRFFAPDKFSCTVITATTGIVQFNNICYQTNTITAKKYIYSIATPIELTNAELINQCFYLPQMPHSNQQQFIYKKIIDRYNSITGNVKKNIVLAKDKAGIPFLNCGSNLHIPVSITHHGRFAAFSIH